MTLRLRRLIVIGLFLALPGMAHAQEATISGTLTDSTGGVLPGVTVTAVHEASGNVFTAVTDERGAYRIALRTGVYRLTAELEGFATLNRSGLELLVGQQAVVNLQMEPSSLKESVTVSGQAPLVNTSSSSIGGNVDTRQLSELPVNGRNWVDLTMLAPGSRANAIAETPTTRNANNAGTFQLNVDGQQVTQNQALDFGQPRLSRDAIAEFQFIANRFDATQGRSSGVQVNAITKSGTNTYAGSTSGYFRDDSLNAADFIQNRVLPYSNSQVSVTFGGPIKKDRVHFFGNYEYTREPQTFTYNTPYPAFNIDQTGTRRENTGGAKLDIQFSPQTRMSVRANGYSNMIPYEPTTASGATRHPSAAESRDKHATQVFVAITQVLNNHALNELRGGYAAFGWFRNGVVKTANAIATPSAGSGSASPRINFSGFTIGPANTNLPAQIEPRSYSLRDNFTYSFSAKGHHDMKLGGEYLYAPDNGFLPQSPFGVLDAQGGPIPAPATLQALFPVWNDVTTWNLAALTPIARSFQQSVGKFGSYLARHSSGYWVQDDWQMSPHVTVNLGVRYDLQLGALAETELLDPFMTAVRPADKNNIAPRLGFAWTLNDRTVIRGGYGKFYAEVTDNFASNLRTSLGQILAQVLPDGRANWAADPFNGKPPTFEQAQAQLCTASTASTCLRRSISGLPGPGMEIPYSYQSSIGLQRQVGETMSVTADYVYTASRHEITSQNINVSYNAATGVNLPFTTTASRPYPNWGTVTMNFSNGLSNTHSLQTAFTKRFSQRWQATGTYTLSGLWDLLPQPYSGLTQVPFPVARDLGNEYTLGVTDQRHRAVFNGIWDAGLGFQLSGLYFFGSGERYVTTWAGDTRNTGGTTGRLRTDGTIVPRNNFVGRPIHRVDLRIQRAFKLGGHARAEGILETFNLFNHANYGAYSTQESVPASYGQPTQNVSLAYAPRMLQLGFRLTF